MSTIVNPCIDCPKALEGCSAPLSCTQRMAYHDALDRQEFEAEQARLVQSRICGSRRYKPRREYFQGRAKW